jgi:hypothetical protein
LLAAAGALAVASCGQDGPPPCPEVYADPQVQIPASNIEPPTLSRFYPINAATTSAPAGVSISIVSSQGTIAYGGRGPFPVFINQRTDDFPDSNSRLYGGLGVADGAWFPFWLYCTVDGRLFSIYGEMSDRDTTVWEDVDGTCTDQGVDPLTRVSLPAHTLSPIALTCGFTVNAPGSLDLTSSNVGNMTYMGGAYSVFPFHTVDCRDCDSPGWIEIHSILWNPAQPGAGFGIFYLDDTGVSLGADGIALPGGQLVGDNVPFSGATWSFSR